MRSATYVYSSVMYALCPVTSVLSFLVQSLSPMSHVLWPVLYVLKPCALRAHTLPGLILMCAVPVRPCQYWVHTCIVCCSPNRPLQL